MITTIDIKNHLRDVFELGHDGGRATILLLGSCRTVAYLNYLDRFNKMNGMPLHIYAIEPNNYHWNELGQDVNIEEELLKCETNQRILSIIRDTSIFIHEHYANFGLFNTDKTGEKHIYQFGMNPAMDIAIPNFHDHFILEKDYEACGITCPDDYIQRGEKEVEKFCEVCAMSSFPEFSEVFFNTWRDIRYFWRPNHVSSNFTITIFTLMNERFLRLPLNEEFWQGAREEDLFKEPHTQVSDRDIHGYRLKWR